VSGASRESPGAVDRPGAFWLFLAVRTDVVTLATVPPTPRGSGPLELRGWLSLSGSLMGGLGSLGVLSGTTK